MTDELISRLRAGDDLWPSYARAQERARTALAADPAAEVAYATVDSPVGRLVVAATAAGLVRLSFGDEDLDAVLDGMAARLSPRIVEAPARLDEARRELDEYFAGQRRAFAIPIDWTLTAGFARRILESTARIPFGSVRTYRDVAAEAGNPKATRAAGNALGSNPIAIVVPCHRVLRTGGGLGGYGGGLPTKEFLLRLEGALL